MNPLDAIAKLKKDYTEFLRASFPISSTLPFLSESLAQVIDEEGKLFRGPFLELTPPYRQGATLRELVEEGVLHSGILELSQERLPPDRPLYLHQEQSIRTAVAGGNVCVAAGTGSGKTECFLVPIIDYILRQQDHTSLPGVKAVLMYPMNALVEDQLARLRQLLGGDAGRTITFGRYTGLTKETEADFQDDLRGRGLPVLPNEVGSRERLRRDLPDILMTNFSMLQYLLLRPRDRAVFEGTAEGLWRFLVLDEVHSYRGVQGIEVGMLLRRFMQRVNRLQAGMQCFATSATLSSSADDEKLLLQFLEDVFSRSFEDESGRIIRGETVPPEENRYYDAPDDELYSISERDLVDCPSEFFDRDLTEWTTQTVDDVAEKSARELFLDNPPDWLARLADSCAKPTELLFEIGRRNRDVHRLVAELTRESVLSVQELTERLGMSKSEAVRRLIRLGTVARPEPEAHPLVSARYHFFIRGPQGARACLSENCPHNPPADDDLLASRTALTGAEACECGRSLYQVGICRNCGQPYIIGYLGANGQDLYAVRDDAGERVRRYLVPRSQIQDSEYAESRDATVTFCTENEEETFRETPSVEYSFVARNERGHAVPASFISQCFRCGDRRGMNSEAVSGFASEGDIAQIVLLQSVLQAQGAAPKALVFSDSRQGAAKFAVTLNYTAKSALTRQLTLRLLAEDNKGASAIESLKSQFPNATEEMVRAFLQQAGHQPDQQQTGLGLDDLGRRLRRSEDACSCGLYADVDMEDDIDKDARARVYAEFGTMLNRRLNLGSLGLCRREVELSSDGDDADLVRAFRPLGIDTPENARNLLQLLLGTLLDQGVADRESQSMQIPDQYPVLLPAAPHQNHVILDGSGRRAKSNEISWLPRGANMRNSRTSLLEKLARENGIPLDASAIRQILTDVFAYLNHRRAFDQANGDQNIIGLRRVRISRETDVWECAICGSRSYFPVKLANGELLCPVKDCRGRLQPRLCPQAKDGFYERLYLEEPPIRLVAREHTAQLGERSTREYQDSFANESTADPNRINVLSCSTTFEMGVDLGDLSAVFMRNIPPEVANYRQRAGRAGRRSGQEAMIFTFARSRSHDAYYFAEPTRMIAGDVRPPALNMGNPELRRRHINVFLMADYLGFLDLVPKRELLLGDIWPVAELSVLPRGFQEWLGSRAPSLRDTCETFAQSLREGRDADTLVREFSEDIQRIGRGLVRQREDLEKRRQRLSDEITKENNLRTAESALKAIRRELDRLAKERLIDFLVKNQVLPGFGFPVHVVELDTRAEGLDLTRDKSIALLEYAPGNTVVADGYAIPSVGLKDSYFREEEDFFYRICCGCGHVEVRGEDALEQHCPVCGTDLETPATHPQSPRQKMLVPVGFTSDTSSLPKKAGATIIPSFHRRQSFVRFGDEGTEMACHPTGVYTTLYAGDAELYAVNTGEPGGDGFRFCTSCRRLVPKGTRHQRPFGGDCRNQFFDEHLHLGHRFRTDAVRMRFAQESVPGLPAPNDLGFWRSLSYAVLKGAVIELQIERNDLGAVVQPYNVGASYGQEIILYDAVPGGAGYCRYFQSHNRIERILQAALEVVSKCDCDPDSSCHRCLRTYDNAPYHRQLRRGPVVEILNRILAVMEVEGSFIPFGNVTYFVARQLRRNARRISLALDHIPMGIPAGERRPWIELLGQTDDLRLLVGKQSLSRDWVAAHPHAISVLRTVLNLLSEQGLELRAVERNALPPWNVVCEAGDEMAAIALERPDFGPTNSIRKWTYRQREISEAAAAFQSVFEKGSPIGVDDIEAVVAPVHFRQYAQGERFDMREDLKEYYGAGARIHAAFINDRYLVDCQFESLKEHLTLIREHGVEDEIPVLVLTEHARDATARADQKELAKEVEYRFSGTNVRLMSHHKHSVEHQRFVIIAREDGTFSRLTMDPGIDVIARHKRANWPAGPVFQRTELYYVQDYSLTALNPEADEFLLQGHGKVV